jgi:hypothetical protein
MPSTVTRDSHYCTCLGHLGRLDTDRIMSIALNHGHYHGCYHTELRQWKHSLTSKEYLPYSALVQGDQKVRKNNLPNFSKSSPESLQVKKGQNVYYKAQFESPKHQHQTTFETLKYLQQTMFPNCLFR